MFPYVLLGVFGVFSRNFVRNALFLLRNCIGCW
jgi:hypothetical protein